MEIITVIISKYSLLSPWVMGSKHHAFSELQRLWRYRRQPEGVKILMVLVPNENLHTALSSSFVQSSRLDCGRPGSLSTLEEARSVPSVVRGGSSKSFGCTWDGRGW